MKITTLAAVTLLVSAAWAWAQPGPGAPPPPPASDAPEVGPEMAGEDVPQLPPPERRFRRGQAESGTFGPAEPRRETRQARRGGRAAGDKDARRSARRGGQRGQARGFAGMGRGGWMEPGGEQGQGAQDAKGMRKARRQAARGWGADFDAPADRGMRDFEGPRAERRMMNNMRRHARDDFDGPPRRGQRGMRGERGGWHQEFATPRFSTCPRCGFQAEMGFGGGFGPGCEGLWSDETPQRRMRMMSSDRPGQSGKNRGQVQRRFDGPRDRRGKGEARGRRFRGFDGRDSFEDDGFGPPRRGGRGQQRRARWQEQW